MTIILNRCYGGFHIPEEFAQTHGLNRYDRISRTDPELIAFVQSKGGKIAEGCAALEAVEVPDNCTDWIMEEYDGCETIIYVVDGKIHHA